MRGTIMKEYFTLLLDSHMVDNHQSVRGTLSIISDALPQLKESAQKTARYILNHPRETVNLTVTELSKRVGVSEASIVRFAQSVGYSGFHALKIALAEDIVSPLQLVHEAIDLDDSVLEVAQKVFTAGMRSLEDTAKLLDAVALEYAANALIDARQILILSTGNSSPLAMDLKFRLTKIGLLARSSLDPTSQEMMASLASKSDVAIGISHMGSSKDTVNALRLAKQAGAITICVTNHSDSPITHTCDIKLFTATRENLFREEEMASNLAALAVIEALYVSISMKLIEASTEAARKAMRATRDRKF